MRQHHALGRGLQQGEAMDHEKGLGMDKREIVSALEALLDDYFDLAWLEGAAGRMDVDENGAADELRHHIDQLIETLAGLDEG